MSQIEYRKRLKQVVGGPPAGFTPLSRGATTATPVAAAAAVAPVEPPVVETVAPVVVATAVELPLEPSQDPAAEPPLPDETVTPAPSTEPAAVVTPPVAVPQ